MPKLPRNENELLAEIQECLESAIKKKIPIISIGVGPELGKILRLCDDKGPLPNAEVFIKDSDGNLYPVEVFGDIYGPCVMGGEIKNLKCVSTVGRTR